MILHQLKRSLLLALFPLFLFSCNSNEPDVAGKKSSQTEVAEQRAAVSMALETRKLNADALRIEEILPMLRMWASSDEFAAFWLEYGAEPVPAIDFQKAVVVGIFLGSKPNLGYAVAIDGVSVVGDELLVAYRNILPDPKMDYPAMIVYPYELIVVESTAKQAFFRAVD